MKAGDDGRPRNDDAVYVIPLTCSMSPRETLPHVNIRPSQGETIGDCRSTGRKFILIFRRKNSDIDR